MNVSEQKLVIQASKGFRHVDFKEIWQYRGLLYFFTWRDLKIRYKQTAIGVLWAVLQPFLTMVVFSVFFGKLVQVPSDGIPYPVFVYLGLLPWNLFSQSVSRSAESIVSHANLVKKVYFPRLIIPVSSSLAALVDFFVAFIILIGLVIYYHLPVSSMIIYLPLLIALNFFCAVGIGFWLSALNVLYRDVRYIVPFCIQLGMYVTPVIYPVSLVPDKYAWALYLNPMAGIIESYRAIFTGKPLPMEGLTMSLAVSVVFFIVGIYYFKKVERVFADLI
jgi:lipopolysaccharide transport system permease protein